MFFTDRLVGVPNVQPPQPSDWAIGPTYPLHDNMPYHLAQYWDKGLRERVEERKAAWAVHRKKTVTATSHQPGGATTAISLVVSSSVAKTRADVGKVPKDLRATAKKTPAVKAWLRVLEEPVREFVVQQQRGQNAAAKRGQQQQQQKTRESGNQSDELGSDEEEILFTGRKTAAAASVAAGGKPPVKNTSPEKGTEKGIQLLPDSRMVLDTLGDNESGASFKYVDMIPGFVLLSENCVLTKGLLDVGSRIRFRTTMDWIPSPSRLAIRRGGWCTSV